VEDPSVKMLHRQAEELSAKRTEGAFVLSLENRALTHYLEASAGQLRLASKANISQRP